MDPGYEEICTRLRKRLKGYAGTSQHASDAAAMPALQNVLRVGVLTEGCEAPGGGREAPLSESSQRALRELSERSGGALGELCESSRRLREAAGRRREAAERLPEAAPWRRLGEAAGRLRMGPNGLKVHFWAKNDQNRGF